MVMARWVWAFTNPGSTMPPPASSTVASGWAARTAALGPTATIAPAAIATAPSSITVSVASTVTTVPLLTTNEPSGSATGLPPVGGQLVAGPGEPGRDRASDQRPRTRRHRRLPDAGGHHHLGPLAGG